MSYSAFWFHLTLLLALCLFFHYLLLFLVLYVVFRLCPCLENGILPTYDYYDSYITKGTFYTILQWRVHLGIPIRTTSLYIDLSMHTFNSPWHPVGMVASDGVHTAFHVVMLDSAHDIIHIVYIWWYPWYHSHGSNLILLLIPFAWLHSTVQILCTIHMVAVVTHCGTRSKELC